MNERVRRGIDLSNRLGQASISQKIGNFFTWWKGSPFNSRSFLLIAAVFLINLLIVYPVFSKNVTVAYSSSAFLLVSGYLDRMGILRREILFTFLTIFSLAVAPISIYLFVRKITLRNDLMAFLTTLGFILPQPINGGELPLVHALLNGDGAHVFVFSLMPLFLLYFQAFLSVSLPAWFLICVLGTGAIAIISPFAFFNLLIFFSVITISEGFLGKLRIKVARLFTLLVFAFGVSLFWYLPLSRKILDLSHVEFTLQKFWSVFPVIIPVVPVFGALSFLIFDRREKLKPLFIGMTLFIIYAFLFRVSKNLDTTGIFRGERYLPELSFASSLFFSIIFVIIFELAIRKYINLIERYYFALFFFAAFLITSGAIWIGLRVNAVHENIINRWVNDQYGLGISAIWPNFDFRDPLFILSLFISLGTLFYILFLVFRFSKFTSAQVDLYRNKSK